MEKCNKIEQMVINGRIKTDLVSENDVEIDKHLSECASCREFVSDLKKVSSTLRSAEKLSVSEKFDHKLKMKLDAVKKENFRKTPVPLFNKFMYYASGVAAIVIAFIYVTSTGILENSEGQGPSVISPVIIAQADQTDTKEKNITDSLENLKNNVADDENIRLNVSVE